MSDKTLYAIDPGHGDGEIVFDTSGWTEHREKLYDAVTRLIDVDALCEGEAQHRLKVGVRIGEVGYSGGEWSVSLDSETTDEYGHDTTDPTSTHVPNADEVSADE